MNPPMNGPPIGDDARDEELAAQLAVDPLDDGTRRRLVTHAMAATRSNGRSGLAVRWIAAAAVAILLVSGGIGLLVTSRAHDDKPSAAPVRTPKQPALGVAGGSTTSAPPLAAANAQGATPSAGSAPGLGDFGDLDRSGNLDRLRHAFAQATPTASQSDRGGTFGAQLETGGCTSRLPRGTIVAQATGTIGGRSAVVVLTVLDDGTRSIDAVLTDPCTVRHLS